MNPFAMTRRFLTAYALSQLYGALFELRSIVPTQPVDDLEAQLNSMHATSVKLLLASYAFFAILSYINEYERRQRHIVELSEEIMGGIYYFLINCCCCKKKISMFFWIFAEIIEK